MTNRAVGSAGGDPAGLRRVLVSLCVTQITSWGVLVYAFPVMAPQISSSTGWHPTAVIAGFSLSQLTSALAGIPVGRVLDRRGPRLVMTSGSLLAAFATIGMALASSLPVYLVMWFLIGVSTSAVLYQPAFAAITRWYGSARVRALTTVTLIGGLASTVFAPLTAALIANLDWRRSYLVLACVLAAVTVPLHVWGLRRPWSPAPVVDEVAGRRADDPRHIARSRAFIMLVVAMSLGGFAVYAVVVASVPLFAERGMSTTVAAWALGLGGVGQVLSRLGYGRLVNRTTPRTRTAGILLAAAITTALFAFVPGPVALLIGIAILAGAARGVFTLLHATAITDRWGAAHYGRLSGLLSAPLIFTGALAPWVATALAGVLGGYPIVFGFLALLSGVAAVLSLAATPSRRVR